MVDAVTAPAVRGERAGVLPVDEDELVACVACGLCLPHCPTYRVTGLERLSPRGRIAAMQAVEFDRAPLDDAFRDTIETCVQCRGCEAACPSTVPFGHLIEGANEALASHPAPATDTRRTSRRLAEWFGFTLVLPRHRLLLAATWVLLVRQRLRLVPRRLGLPRLSARSLRTPLVADDPPARRVPLPGLRDGRVAARRAPRRAPGDARRGRARRATRRPGATAAARSTPTPVASGRPAAWRDG